MPRSRCPLAMTMFFYELEIINMGFVVKMADRRKLLPAKGVSAKLAHAAAWAAHRLWAMRATGAPRHKVASEQVAVVYPR